MGPGDDKTNKDKVGVMLGALGNGVKKVASQASQLLDASVMPSGEALAKMIPVVGGLTGAIVSLSDSLTTYKKTIVESMAATMALSDVTANFDGIAEAAYAGAEKAISELGITTVQYGEQLKKVGEISGMVGFGLKEMAERGGKISAVDAAKAQVEATTQALQLAKAVGVDYSVVIDTMASAYKNLGESGNSSQAMMATLKKNIAGTGLTMGQAVKQVNDIASSMSMMGISSQSPAGLITENATLYCEHVFDNIVPVTIAGPRDSLEAGSAAGPTANAASIMSGFDAES